MNPEEKLEKAKIDIICWYPPLAHILVRVPTQVITRDEAIRLSGGRSDVAMTDGRTILFSDKWLETAEQNDIVFVSLHEVGHILLLHSLRFNPKVYNAVKANIAMDYAVNQLLQDLGLTVPQNALYDKKYKDMSWEQIYRQLPDNQKLDMKDVIFSDEKLIAEEQKEMVKEIQQAVADIKEAMRQQGHSPSDLEKLTSANTVESSLYSALNHFVQSSKGDKYLNYAKQYRKYSGVGGVIVPTMRGEKLSIVCIIDTSGSVWEEKTLSDLYGVINGVLRRWDTDATLIMADAEVQKIDALSSKNFNPKNLKMKGGGGTDFAPALNLAKEKYAGQPVIYITDGECNSFPKSWGGTPVLWVVPAGTVFKPPFGRVFVYYGG